MKRSITLITLIAGLALAAPAVVAPVAQASGITKCGSYDYFGHRWYTRGIVYGYTPVYNLTTRGVNCRDARNASLTIMNHHMPRFGSRRNSYYHGFTCRWQWFNGEDWDVRCTRGSQVMHWQGGA